MPLEEIFPPTSDGSSNAELTSVVDDKEEGVAEAEVKVADEARQTRKAKQEIRRSRQATAMACLQSASMEALLLALRHTHPLAVLRKLLCYVMPSSPLLLYSPYVEVKLKLSFSTLNLLVCVCFFEPLLECYKFLKENDRAISIRLTDSFFRHQQVLPQRTHPEMTQFVAGGFLLTAISVIPNR